MPLATNLTISSNTRRRYLETGNNYLMVAIHSDSVCHNSEIH